MNKITLIAMVALLLLVGGCTKADVEVLNAAPDEGTEVAEDIAATDETEETAEEIAEKVITVKMRMFEFEPDPLMLKLGETVTLELIAEDVPHGFAIPDLGIKSTQVTPGETLRMTITPEQAGTFGMRCNIFCGSGHKEMTGTVIVE